MFRYITAALACAVAIGLAEAGETKPSRAVTLDEAVARAIEASPSLQARGELVAGADAQVRQSGAFPNPTIDAQLENFAGSGRFSDLDESELTLGLTQRFERGAKREGRTAVAQAERAAAQHEQERTRLNVVFDARKAFVDVVAAETAFANADARLKAAREIEAMAARRVNAARDPVTAKLRAEIQTAEARAARTQAEHDLHNARRTLALLWGTTEDDFKLDAASLKLPAGDPKTHGIGVAPDVAAREIAARRAAAKATLEEANARSDVSLGVGVRRFENGGDLAGVLTFSMPLAVFDGNEGAIERARAERRAADLDVADAERRYQTALVVLEEEAVRSRTELDALRNEMLPRARSALAAARRGYSAGAFSYQEIAEAQRLLAELSAREVVAFRTLHTAHASLDRLTGAAGQGEKQ
jgi:cobalt-zinc-cadmium efflux system outer membrane protein